MYDQINLSNDSSSKLDKNLDKETNGSLELNGLKAMQRKMLKVKSDRELKRIPNRNTGTEMRKALELIRAGISIREAAKMTNLAYATVRRYWLKTKLLNFSYPNDNNISSNSNQNTTNYMMANNSLPIPQKNSNNDEQESPFLDFYSPLSNFQQINSNNNNMQSFPQNEHMRQGTSSDKRIIPSRNNNQNNLIRRSLPLPDQSDQHNINNEIQITNIKSEICNISDEEVDDDVPHDSDFESTSDEGSNTFPTNNITDSSIQITRNERSAVEEPKTPNKISSSEEQLKMKFIIPDPETVNDRKIDVNSILQTELLNTLRKIEYRALIPEKDPDELFLLSLLPSLKNVKESNKIKAKIRILESLQEFIDV